MAVTATDLYRMGNAAGPRLDYVRPKDVTTFSLHGDEWVQVGPWGVSASSVKRAFGGPWWMLPAGTQYDDKLIVIWNNHGNHWLFGPAFSMPLTSYKAALSALNANFIRA